MANKVDVIVIGAGTAGYPCAIRLAQLKKKVLVIEEKELGGVCLNWGCIPTKALISAAEAIDRVGLAKKMGLRINSDGIDLAALRGWKDGIIRRLRMGIDYQFKKVGVQVLSGQARIVSAKKVEVPKGSGTTTVEADILVVATGTEISPLPGLEFDGKFIIHTDHALALSDIPGTMLVIGAGASGLEMATIYSRFGSKVTVLEIMDQILPGMETEACAVLQKILQKSGIDVRVKSTVKGYRIEGGAVQVQIDSGGVVSSEVFDRILVTVGRRPVTRLFSDWHPAFDAKGYFTGDNNGRTQTPGLFSIGDIAGPPLLAHKATFQGVRCAETIAGLEHPGRSPAIPSCVFTLPPFSSVGMTEREAKDRGIDFKIGRCPYRVSGRALAMGESEGFVKIIADHDNLILGIHILGAESSSLIGEAVICVDQRLNAEQVASTMHPHPTLTETIMEAAENLLGKSIHAG